MRASEKIAQTKSEAFLNHPETSRRFSDAKTNPNISRNCLQFDAVYLLHLNARERGGFFKVLIRFDG